MRVSVHLELPKIYAQLQTAEFINELEKKYHVKITKVPEKENLFEVGNWEWINISAIK